MTVDIDKQLGVFWAVTESVSSVTSIIVILLLLYHKIGGAIFTGLFVLAGAFVFNILITSALLVDTSLKLISFLDVSLSLFSSSTRLSCE